VVTVSPWGRLTAAQVTEVGEEGARLADFLAHPEKGADVRIA
jgi:hypothetical protein